MPRRVTLVSIASVRGYLPNSNSQTRSAVRRTARLTLCTPRMLSVKEGGLEHHSLRDEPRTFVNIAEGSDQMEGGRLHARGACVLADDAEGPPIWKSSVRLESQLEDAPRFPGDAVYAPGDGSPRWARHPTGGAVHATYGPVPPMNLDGAADAEPLSAESAEREKWYKRKWREEWAQSRALQLRVESLQKDLSEAEGQAPNPNPNPNPNRGGGEGA